MEGNWRSKRFAFKRRHFLEKDSSRQNILSRNLQTVQGKISMIRLNVGCGGDLLENYVNIDRHTKKEIEARYGRKLSENIVVQDLDIFNLPHKDGTVDEVLCLGFLEHLSFEEEGRFLKEVERVLKKGGVFHFTVPDFDNLCRQWLEAKDDFKEFYQLRTDE